MPICVFDSFFNWIGKTFAWKLFLVYFGNELFELYVISNIIYQCLVFLPLSPFPWRLALEELNDYSNK